MSDKANTEIEARADVALILTTELLKGLVANGILTTEIAREVIDGALLRIEKMSGGATAPSDASLRARELLERLLAK